MKGPLFFSMQHPTLAGLEERDRIDAMLTAPCFASLTVAPSAQGLANMRRITDPSAAARMAVLDPAQEDGAPADQQCLPHVLSRAMTRRAQATPDTPPDPDLLVRKYREQRDRIGLALTVHLSERLRPLEDIAGFDVAQTFVNEMHAALLVIVRHIFLCVPANAPLVSALTDIFAAGAIPCGWFGTSPDSGPGEPSRALAYLALR